MSFYFVPQDAEIIYNCKVGVLGVGWISLSSTECLLSEVIGEKI